MMDVSTTLVDQLALLPAYLAAATALVVLLAGFAFRDAPTVGRIIGLVGAAATAGASWWSYQGGSRSAFCTPCSYVWDSTASTAGILFAAITFVALGLSIWDGSRTPSIAVVLTCSLTGGVVLGAARELLTLVLALELLTLPLCFLMGFRYLRGTLTAAAVTLLGVALLYATTGWVHLDDIATTLGDRSRLPLPLVGTAIGLLLVGLVAQAVPVPDDVPAPVAAFASTAPKLGAAVAVLLVAVRGLDPWPDLAGPLIATIAVLTMTIGNLRALREPGIAGQLGWFCVAQVGYLLAPIAVITDRPQRVVTAITGMVLTYATLFLLLTLIAYAALRGARRTIVVLPLLGLALLPLLQVRPLIAGEATGLTVLTVLLVLNVLLGIGVVVRKGTLLTHFA